ncbi:fumarylacetoacetate hydrolase family protein [Pelagibacterium xiamenense]|uniref:fumarylacetoacetate hydrolase family protein n=1 Tax=Pelagibacterium xiamenense TaxID=2901140 RepID=UPI001E3BF214|nr:fumarylacetoacetate hydrolase family protein [Pelagibacterium xiamenense]MCD7060646.1 fumarylacetoacetate hydrolase family protein [Pelagibacterium xiamenense]
MKLGTILQNNKAVLVAERDGKAVPVVQAYKVAGLEDAPCTFNDLVEAGKDELARLTTAVRQAPLDIALELEHLNWLPPQPRPSKVIGVAFNNMGIRKSAHKDPGVPNFFFKAPSCLTGHNQPIVMEKHYGETIPELELGGVIGKRCKHISVQEAKEAIFGYTIINDVTSHGLKFGMDSIATTREPHLLRSHHLAWRNRKGEDDNDVYFVYHARSKASDTFGPMGPWITTADEIADPNSLDVKGWLDGKPFAVDNTSSYRFKIEEVVAEASRYFTLEPGDVICFGTSAKGVGEFPNGHRNVNLHQRDGTITIEIEGLGSLANPIQRSWAKQDV